MWGARTGNPDAASPVGGWDFAAPTTPDFWGVLLLSEVGSAGGVLATAAVMALSSTPKKVPASV
jgi:hypothetical protein